MEDFFGCTLFPGQGLGLGMEVKNDWIFKFIPTVFLRIPLRRETFRCSGLSTHTFSCLIERVARVGAFWDGADASLEG